jgi:hypothetical protein
MKHRTKALCAALLLAGSGAAYTSAASASAGVEYDPGTRTYKMTFTSTTNPLQFATAMLQMPANFGFEAGQTPTWDESGIDASGNLAVTGSPFSFWYSSPPFPSGLVPRDLAFTDCPSAFPSCYIVSDTATKTGTALSPLSSGDAAFAVSHADIYAFTLRQSLYTVQLQNTGGTLELIEDFILYNEDGSTIDGTFHHVYSTSLGGTPQVPVPAALPLLGSALAGLGLVARRRRKS